MSVVRDEFSAATRKTLVARAGMRCSNPSCRRATAKADPTDTENWIDLGVAAHITAASQRGPRYDGSLSREQRCSAHNGVWLCHHCAKEVDSTESTYEIATLRTWKEQAEACTARDAAATLDAIAQLIADIESTRGAISAYVEERQATDPVIGLVGASRGEWSTRTKELMRHSTTTQTDWDSRVAPLVVDCLTRATGLLGEHHPAISQASTVSRYARTNLLCMKDMAETLDALRTHLLFR